jgi:uncharacterized protein YkwD
MPVRGRPGTHGDQSRRRHERLERRIRLIRATRAVTALLGALLGQATPLCAALPADPVLDAARALRTAGCDARPGVRTELRRDRSLDAVAARWAAQGAGGRLELAFESERVRARQSASLALLRARPDSVAPALRQRLCRELTSPEWTRLGWHAGADGVWIVLAVPSDAPQPRDLAQVAATTLRLTNELRARGARCGSRTFGTAPPLRLAPALTRAAQRQADEMARYRYLAHEGRDGSTPAQRATQAGYAWRAVGENVAAGAESAAEVLLDWERSPDHCRNLLDPEFTEMGIAYALNPQPTGHSTWWSMVLARPR